MDRQILSNLDLELYHKVLKNGLEIFICPIDRHDAHASIVTKYGNDILDFKFEGDKEFISIPAGTAHYLEHKMFEQEDGIDPMSFFSANGAYSNAYTSSKVTRYHFTCASSFFENLQMLLDCVTKPYFTKENIQKEQGIIAEEIKMGFDNPNRMLYFLTLKGLFKNHPHQYPVAGYIESIKNLTKEDMYNAYNTFYHPSNMFMVVTGAVDAKKTMKFIEEYYNKKDYKPLGKVVIKDYKEPKTVTKRKQVHNMEVTNKLITKAYKVPLPEDFSKFEIDIFISIYLGMTFGSTTDFYYDTFHDKNILRRVASYAEIVDKYLIIYFDTEVMDDISIVDKVDKLLKAKKTSEEDFKLIIKNILINLITNSENVNASANFIVNLMIDYGTFYPDIYDKCKNLKYERFKEFIDLLDFEESTLSIITKESWFLSKNMIHYWKLGGIVWK